MVNNADHIAPFTAIELSEELNVPKSSIYYAVNQLRKHGLIKTVKNGSILSDSILLAGGKYQGQFNQQNNFKKLQEKLYG